MLNSRPTNVRWLIVAMLVGIAFLAHFNRVSISVAGNAHFIGPDKLSEEQMGVVYSAFLLVYTLGMLPGGWLIDRLGPRLALAGMGVGLGLCGILTGLLGFVGLAISALFVPLLLVRGVAGASSITLHPGAARSVSLWFPLSSRSTANGLVTAGALVGIAVTYPVFGWLMGQFDWPRAFIVSGAALAVFGLTWYALSADDPNGHPWSNAAERELVAEGIDTPPRSVPTLREFLSLGLLTLSYGALSYVQYLFFYWIEYYFGKVLNLPQDESRAAAFVVTISMAVGMAFGGLLSDWMCRWFGQVAGYRAIAFVGMGSCALLSLLGVSLTNTQQIIWCFSLSFAALGMCEGIFWTTAPVLAPRNGGLACALVNTGGNGVGLLAPILTPILGRHYGWNSAIVVGCIVCGIGALLWIGIRSERTK